jgi:hypothetical protein
MNKNTPEFRSFRFSYKTYEQFIKDYKNNRLSKFERITCRDKKVLNEIFNTKIEKLDFKLDKIQNDEYIDLINYKYTFKSAKNNEYIFEIEKFKEDNNLLKNEILHNKIFLNMSFTIADNTIDNYDKETYLNEQFDVMNRIVFLLDNFKDNYFNKDNEIFMFTTKSLKKQHMYEYIIEKYFSNYKIIKDYCNRAETNIGYYLIEIEQSL